MSKALLSLLLLLSAIPAHAVLLDVRLRSAIKDACLAHHPRDADAVRFCGCVGTRHFRSAKQMPDAARGAHDLKWVLAYYTAPDQKALARLRTDPDNLLAYDAFIGKVCRNEAPVKAR